MKVFVTDAKQRSSLAVVRSLGRAGVFVGVGDTRRDTLAGSSKFCAESMISPSPVHEPQEFQEFLVEELPKRGYEFLLATTDVTVQLASAIKPRVEPGMRVLTEESAKLSQLQDKGAVLEMATQLEIGVPKFVSYEDRDEALRFAESVGYPVVVKPRRSRLLCGGKWREGAVNYAYTPSELIQLCDSIHAEIPCPLVQERLRGEGRGVFLLMWHGEVKAAFCHRRLREKPPWGGVSVLSESVAPDKQLIEQSANLLRELEWSGPAMVEFKSDSPEGKPKLMEVNGRFWGSLRLAIDSGIDFPLMYLRLMSGENVAPQLEYRSGIRNRWFLADLDSLLTRLRPTERQRALYCDEKSRAKALAEFFRPGGRNLHFDVFDRSDSRPAWTEWKQYVKENAGLLFRSRNGGEA